MDAETDPDMQQLYNLLTDRMDCCFLIGYTMDGRRVQITHCNSAKDRDALEVYLNAACDNFVSLKELLAQDISPED